MVTIHYYVDGSLRTNNDNTVGVFGFIREIPNIDGIAYRTQLRNFTNRETTTIQQEQMAIELALNDFRDNFGPKHKAVIFTDQLALVNRWKSYLPEEEVLVFGERPLLSPHESFAHFLHLFKNVELRYYKSTHCQPGVEEPLLTHRAYLIDKLLGDTLKLLEANYPLAHFLNAANGCHFNNFSENFFTQINLKESPKMLEVASTISFDPMDVLLGRELISLYDSPLSLVGNSWSVPEEALKEIVARVESGHNQARYQIIHNQNGLDRVVLVVDDVHYLIILREGFISNLLTMLGFSRLNKDVFPTIPIEKSRVLNLGEMDFSKISHWNPESGLIELKEMSKTNGRYRDVPRVSDDELYNWEGLSIGSKASGKQIAHLNNLIISQVQPGSKKDCLKVEVVRNDELLILRTFLAPKAKKGKVLPLAQFAIPISAKISHKKCVDFLQVVSIYKKRATLKSGQGTVYIPKNLPELRKLLVQVVGSKKINYHPL